MDDLAAISLRRQGPVNAYDNGAECNCRDCGKNVSVLWIEPLQSISDDDKERGE